MAPQHRRVAWLLAAPVGGFMLRGGAAPGLARASKRAAAAVESEADLEAIYAKIAEALPQQEVAYSAWLGSGAVDAEEMRAQARALNLDLDVDQGTVSYSADWETPALPFELWYCRHGKTTGNTEPRVFQGYVDEPSNALNEIGLEDAADKLAAVGLGDPALIVMSPLSRAAETGDAFVRRFPHLKDRVEWWPSTAEMRFGGWDNAKVKDMAANHMCHLFYLKQNAVVKSAEPYVSPSDPEQTPYASENFVDVLERMQRVLDRIEVQVNALPERDDGKLPIVLMYGHSMAGAALSILTGNGKQVDGQSFLGFDGKYIMPNATPVRLYPTDMK